MKKNIWFWGFILLLILNIAAISSIFLHRKSVERECRYMEDCRNSPDRFHHLKEELKMDDKQWQEFRHIRDEHHESMELFRNSLKDKHRELFELVSSESKDSLRLETIKAEICSLHNEISDESINYYIQAKSICSKEQIDALNEHFRSLFMRPERNPKCHPK